MSRRAGFVFLALVLAQACHSVEEYAFRLYDVLPPARFVSSLVSDDLARGFAVVNALLVAFGLWCWLVPVRRRWASARSFVWPWVMIEVGNGVGHPALAIWSGGYFPGVATAPLLLVLALALAALLRRGPGAPDRSDAGGGSMGLWERVKAHLERRTPLRKDKDGRPADLEVQVATAIILLEAAHGDEEYEWREHRAIVRGLEHGFGIGRAETLELLGRAESIRPPVVRLADVTHVIADRYSPEQRRAIVSLLWRVIDADEVVYEWERTFADHVAQAVGLSPVEAELARRGEPAGARR